MVQGLHQQSSFEAILLQNREGSKSSLLFISPEHSAE